MLHAANIDWSHHEQCDGYGERCLPGQQRGRVVPADAADVPAAMPLKLSACGERAMCTIISRTSGLSRERRCPSFPSRQETSSWRSRARVWRSINRWPRRSSFHKKARPFAPAKMGVKRHSRRRAIAMTDAAGRLRCRADPINRNRREDRKEEHG